MARMREKIRAVKNTIKQWEWYIKNPEEKKDDYFFETGARIPEKFLCYLCDIWHKFDLSSEFVCKECPLATKTLICDDDLAPNAPYPKWGHFENFLRSLNKKEKAERIKQAKRIVNACRRWLKKYDV